MVCYYVASVTNHSEESPVSLNINKSTPEDSVSGVQLVSVDSLERVTLKHTWLNMKAEHFHVICALNGFRAREVSRDIMWNISSSSSVIHSSWLKTRKAPASNFWIELFISFLNSLNFQAKPRWYKRLKSWP